MSLARIPDLLGALRAGRPVIVVDDEGRENEGDLLMPAQTCTPAWVNFMARHGRGLICVTLGADRAERLRLPAMVRAGTDPHGTAFTVSVDHVSNSTGISAFDRAATIAALADDAATPGDFRRPGHIFPLVARDGGVLRRPGHTEAACDLARLAGFAPVGVICEVLHEDGTMQRLPDLQRFAAAHGLLIGSIAELIAYREAHDPAVDADAPLTLRVAASAALPTAYGEFRLVGFEDARTGAEHVALVMGDVTGPPPLVRLHSECLTGDALHSLRCDCGAQRDAALAAIAAEGRGVLVYLRQEGRGIGLLNKIRAYALQDAGADTVEANERLGFPADARDFTTGAEVLRLLGVPVARLLTNNPRKLSGLRAAGVEVVERVPVHAGHSAHNAVYLGTKARKLGHLL
ncbi:bifunctional 3,4-dihydroxy-2-butanone-4-phosphate synthase/GTP cyclohydrolase II [Deinococcus maricopensis]|uniref:Riboflavin biosynthesis protein RibBA n=1 Tax=Deinococcus maricopensis (strain DSM 21211 / LMG 22137 / NRRL B-23946 / LB-34) TaxID=709986 RepID=E8UBC8_DEIML|nr:bifunctional 3,4-dihydroxy-2-butanone-4-phosphate synthase/GTP cyclohydrolase II [Deinococcus maricopensis]ADV68367.1 3,4-dihydroxy-2-butanone 4-phosphate synthase [Deinococcus maricopensis DSM 21211]